MPAQRAHFTYVGHYGIEATGTRNNMKRLPNTSLGKAEAQLPERKQQPYTYNGLCEVIRGTLPENPPAIKQLDTICNGAVSSMAKNVSLLVSIGAGIADAQPRASEDGAMEAAAQPPKKKTWK